MASTLGSRAAWRRNCTTTSKLSNGWWTRMSFSRMAAKQSPPWSRIRSGKRGVVGLELQVGAVGGDQLGQLGQAQHAVDAGPRPRARRAGSRMMKSRRSSGMAASISTRTTGPGGAGFSSASNSRTRSSASSSISTSLSRIRRNTPLRLDLAAGEQVVEEQAIRMPSRAMKRRSRVAPCRRRRAAAARTAATWVGIGTRA